MVVNMGRREKGGGVGMGCGEERERERRKDFLFSLLEGESSLLQRVSRTVCCSRTLCHCGGIAGFLLFVIVQCSPGLRLAAGKGFSEMDSTG